MKQTPKYSARRRTTAVGSSGENSAQNSVTPHHTTENIYSATTRVTSRLGSLVNKKTPRTSVVTLIKLNAKRWCWRRVTETPARAGGW